MWEEITQGVNTRRWDGDGDGSSCRLTTTAAPITRLLPCEEGRKLPTGARVALTDTHLAPEQQAWVAISRP